MRISDWSSDVCSSDLDRGAADPRQFEWLRRAVRVAEGPAVALVAGIPFERDLRPVEIGKTQDAVAENERQGGKPGVDFLRREELLRARPCRVRDAYVLGIEFDVERDRKSTRLHSSH